MKGKLTVEKQIRLYIMKRELTKKYQSLLMGKYEKANAAAIYFLDFAKRTPKYIYYQHHHFRDYLAVNRDNLVLEAKSMNDDINFYWRASLLELKNDHILRIKEYENIFGSRAKLANHISSAKSRIQHLDIIGTDIDQTINNLPQYTFKEAKDLNYWDDLAERSIPTINNAFEAHREVFELIACKRADRARLVDKSLSVLGSTATLAVDVGLKLLGGP